MRLLFGFRGRINRAKYWLAAAIWLVYSGVLAAVILVIAGKDLIFEGDELVDVAGSDVHLLTVVGLFLLLLIPLTVSTVAVGIKRMHDREMSGWWLVLFYLGPTVANEAGRAVVSLATFTEDMLVPIYLGYLSLVLHGSSVVISVWATVTLGILRGTGGPNRYGPDPLAARTPAPSPR